MSAENHWSFVWIFLINFSDVNLNVFNIFSEAMPKIAYAATALCKHWEYKGYISSCFFEWTYDKISNTRREKKQNPPKKNDHGYFIFLNFV